MVDPFAFIDHKAPVEADPKLSVKPSDAAAPSEPDADSKGAE